MKRASVRDLRHNFGKLEKELRSGEEIQITRRNRVFARLIAEPALLSEVSGRLKTISGDPIIEPSSSEAMRAESEPREAVATPRFRDPKRKPRS